MAKPKVFTVQPRIAQGDTISGWSMVDMIFQAGNDLPPKGTVERDTYLAAAWQQEPMLAGAVNKFVEKVQTVDWRIIGGRNQSSYYGSLLQEAEDGRGWTYIAGTTTEDFLSTDKGACFEIARSNTLRDQYYETLRTQASDSPPLQKAIQMAENGRPADLLHVDSARLVRVGIPNARWRYFPMSGNPLIVPNNNLIQIISLPESRERFIDTGNCVVSRVYDAKELMVGYLRFHMQEIGALPPELAIIINGMPASQVEESFKRYKAEAIGKGLDEYTGRWWLGSDNPASPVTMAVHNLINPSKPIDWRMFVEWWVKTVALNMGEAVGDLWLMEHPGNSNTLMSVQAMKAEGSGVGRYLQELERKINRKLLANSNNTRFEFDNKDDDQDRRRADILATQAGTLKTLADLGGEDPTFTKEELRRLALEWDIVPSDMVESNMPTIVTSALKEMTETVWVFTSKGDFYSRKPLLKGSEREVAEKLLSVYGFKN